MKLLSTVLLFLDCISANSQTILPVDELLPLWRMADSLSYSESPESEQKYSLEYNLHTRSGRL